MESIKPDVIRQPEEVFYEVFIITFIKSRVACAVKDVERLKS